jgi:DNA-binding IclR family transcriptional regulator
MELDAAAAEPAADAAATAASTHRSLLRGLAVLEIVAGAREPLTLAEVAARADLPRSTTHQLLRTLAALGHVQQAAASRAWTLTGRLHRLLERDWDPERIGEMAQPWLQELSRLTGVGSSVAAWTQGKVRIVAKRESDGPVRVAQDVGALRPLHCTAVGKAIAAWLPADVLEHALRGVTLERHTPRTITTRAALATELQRVRAAGHALDDEEMYEGLRCVAMPVFGASGQVVASMCAVGPRQQMTRDKLVLVRPVLARLARGLSEQLGYEPSSSSRSTLVRKT